jgi:aspartate kinase
MKVAKFGGTSLANAEQIKKVCRIVRADQDRRLIVVSAPGKRYKDDTKVTDLLINYAERFLQAGEAQAEKQAVFARYQEIVKDLELSAEVGAQLEADRAVHGRRQSRRRGYLRKGSCPLFAQPG